MLLQVLQRSISWKHGTSSSRSFASLSSSSGKGLFDILFCGSDSFSVASLSAVLKAKDVWSSVQVLVPRERNVGRKGKERYRPELSLFAEQHDILTTEVPQEGLKGFTPSAPFNALRAGNLLLTASFGHIIPNDFLELFPPDQRLNVHSSLLPQYRGAAPVQWTIANGDVETGVSVQRLVEKGKGIDGGDILGAVGSIRVGDKDYPHLLDELAIIGGDLLVQVLRDMRDGTVKAQRQDAARATRAPKISHETARIRWPDQNAHQITRLYRAIAHQVPLWTRVPDLDSDLQLLDFRELSAPGPDSDLTPGTAILHKQGKHRRLLVACAKDESGDQTWLEILKVRGSGKKSKKNEMDVGEWWNGLPPNLRSAAQITFA